MGSNLNFNNFGNEQLGDGGGRQTGSFGLVRQPSIYSLTFDEFQSTVGGGIGKDFGSMNMDELLKNIWSAEENQTMGSGSGGQQNGVPTGYLQGQGSLTLPRTLSQKTVDEVWRDIMKEYCTEKDGSGVGGSSMPQRQQTLGEITLEEFLSRAGVVREETQLAGQATNTGVFGDLSHTVNNTGLGFAYQQAGNTGLMGSRIPESNSEIGIESANLLLNMNGARPSQQQLGTSQLQQHQQKVEQQQQKVKQQQQQKVEQQQHQQPLYPKQPALAYGVPMPIPTNGQLHSNGIRGGVTGISDAAINGNLVQGSALQGGGMGMVGLGAGGVTVATGSPAVSSDGLAKSNGDASSVSPVPYAFNGSLRGRKSSAVEKVIERRQRRMIKNRESAARSRARKQAYTTELETEVAKLKEENQELRKKQAEMMEMQKNQAFEMMNLQRGAKRQCLRRTQTSPW